MLKQTPILLNHQFLGGSDAIDYHLEKALSNAQDSKFPTGDEEEDFSPDRGLLTSQAFQSVMEASLTCFH